MKARNLNIEHNESAMKETHVPLKKSEMVLISVLIFLMEKTKAATINTIASTTNGMGRYGLHEENVCWNSLPFLGLTLQT